MGLPAKQIMPVEGYRNKEKTVRDLMIPVEGFSSVSSDITVKNAAYILRNSMSSQDISSEMNCLLVFENKILIGFVSIKELLASVQPLNFRDDWYRGWNVSNWVEPVFMRGLFTSLCHEVAEKTVRDIMEPYTVGLCAESTLEEAVYKLFRQKSNMLPVTEGDKIVGILRADEVFAEMTTIFKTL